MRQLDSCSGPWRGLSIQDGLRIHEDLFLQIGGGRISGTGSDRDGDFTIQGGYDADGSVRVIRKYTYCTAGAFGIGIPYLYTGRWDGSMVYGRWCGFDNPFFGGPFEMWPSGEEESEMLSIAFEDIATVPSG